MLQTKTIRKNLNLFLILATLIPSFSFAWETKAARSNDVATDYTLDDSGNFFRTVNNQKCQITNNVVSFKVSQHPDDTAMVYYARRENYSTPLYVLHNSENTGSCPKAHKEIIVQDLKTINGNYKYSVVSTNKTTIVSLALDTNGTLTGRSNSGTIFTESGITNYKMHNQYGVSGMPFNTYVAFAISNEGLILKVKGKEPADSKFDTSHGWASIEAFMEHNSIR